MVKIIAFFIYDKREYVIIKQYLMLTVIAAMSYGLYIIIHGG